MNVLLKENIKNLGKVGDSVNVAPGYARNWLIPQGKVLLVNDTNRKEIDDRLKELKVAEDAKQKAAEKLVKEISGMGDVVLDCRLNEDGRLFGSIAVSNIVEYYKDKGKALQRKDLNIVNAPIKELGEYELVFSPYHGVKSIIKIKIVSSEDGDSEKGSSVESKGGE